MPCSARSNRPARARSAPVKAPRSCPNSSDSSTPGASALQFTATNGPPTRSDCTCTARAISSLPVPLSPVDEHGGVAPRGAAHHVEHAQHGRALRHDRGAAVALRQLGAQIAVLAREARVIERARHHGQQRVVVEGLLHVVEGAEAQRRHRGGDRGVGRHHHHRDVGVHRAHALEHAEAVEAGHLEVGEQQVEAARGQGVQRGVRRGEALHLVAAAAQHHLEDRDEARLVVEHGDARRHAAAWAAAVRGSTSSKQAPRPPGPAPAPCTTRSSPPWARAMRSAMARPSPVPLALVV